MRKLLCGRCKRSPASLAVARVPVAATPRSRAAEQREELAPPHVGPPPPESVSRTFSLPQGDRQVLWAGLNRSEIVRKWLLRHPTFLGAVYPAKKCEPARLCASAVPQNRAPRWPHGGGTTCNPFSKRSRGGYVPQSTDTPLALIGPDHLSISAATNLAKYSGLRRSAGATSSPTALKRSRTNGRSRVALSA